MARKSSDDTNVPLIPWRWPTAEPSTLQVGHDAIRQKMGRGPDGLGQVPAYLSSANDDPLNDLMIPGRPDAW